MPLASDITIRVKLTKAQLKTRLRHLPGYLSGAVPDRYRWGVIFKNALAHGLFTRIHEGFLAKSDGDEDDLGNTWKPLKQETIAARPLQPGERKRLGIKRGEKHRGLLTATQDRLWRGIFKSNFLRLASRMDEGAAKAMAGQIAWAVLKSQGAKTKLEVLGQRKVPILRVSDRLSDSLAPGSLNGPEYDPPDEQVYKRHHGSIEMGTAVPYAPNQHKTRRLWPKRMSKWVSESIRDAFDYLVGGWANGQGLGD